MNRKFYLSMAGALPQTIENLIEAFGQLPGVGTKTAQRFAFFLLKQPPTERERLGRSILELMTGLRHCATCFHFAAEERCAICNNPKRDDHVLCVVEDSLDLLSIEKATVFRGKYHVLGGVLSPLDGIGPSDLRISELAERIKKSEGVVTEVILATNPTVEGEATATYIWCLLTPLQVKVSRIARGLPVGGDLEFTDEVTLARAIESRIDF